MRKEHNSDFKSDRDYDSNNVTKIAMTEMRSIESVTLTMTAVLLTLKGQKPLKINFHFILTIWSQEMGINVISTLHEGTNVYLHLSLFSSHIHYVSH